LPAEHSAKDAGTALEQPELSTAHTAIKHILDHTVPLGSEVVIEGWVRSRRTSKGGFSFIHVNDGSALDSVQAIADGKLDNYESEILESSTGCGGRIGKSRRIP